MNIWNKQNILEGFKKFFNENERYPTALEIDSCSYLPSSRQIQRSFGGLINLRKELGLEITNYSVGLSRINIATEINARSRKTEREMEEILIKHFGEHFVHVEKHLYKFYDPTQTDIKKYKTRSDFFIYAKHYQFCIDIFYASNMRLLTSIINLVNTNEQSNITKESIEKYTNGMFNKLDSNVKILNKSDFLKLLNDIQPLKLDTR